MRLTWFCPLILVNIQAPSPCVQLTLIPPISEHTRMYHIMLFFPYFGATKNMITRDATIQTLPYERNPGAKNNFLNADIVETDCSSGPFNAMMMAPRIH